MDARRRGDERRRRARRPRRAGRSERPAVAALEATRREALVAEEADLRNYVGAPYVPDYEMRVGRFVTRGQLAMAETSGWTRIGAAVVAGCLLVWVAVAVFALVGIVRTRDGLWGAQVLWLLLPLVVTAPLGFALLRRLLRPAAHR